MQSEALSEQRSMPRLMDLNFFVAFAVALVMLDQLYQLHYLDPTMLPFTRGVLIAGLIIFSVTTTIEVVRNGFYRWISLSPMLLALIYVCMIVIYYSMNSIAR